MSGVEQYAAKVRAALAEVGPALYEALGPTAYSNMRCQLAKELVHSDGVQTVHATLPSVPSVKGARLWRMLHAAGGHCMAPGGVAELMASSALQHSYGHRPTTSCAGTRKRGRPCVGLSPRGEWNSQGHVWVDMQRRLHCALYVQSAHMRLRKAASSRCAASVATSNGRRRHGRGPCPPCACGTGPTGRQGHLVGACTTGAPCHLVCPG